MDKIRIYLESFKLELKCLLEYKSSLILNFLSHFGLFFTYYFLIIALFQKFDNIVGWNMYEVLLCFAIIHFGFTFNEVFFRGVDKFEEFIIDGSLDRLLLRPHNVLFQVVCSKMDIMKFTRLIQAVIILFIALFNLNIEMNFINIYIILMMLICSILIFFALFLIMASYCFITVEGLEVKNLMTDGGKHMAQYPIGIFKKGFLFVFTFIIPYGSVNYYPLLYLLGKSDNLLYLFSPILVFVFLIPAFFLFKLGLKRYESTGS